MRSITSWRGTVGSFALFMCLGLGVALAGPTIPDMARQTGSTEAALGSLFLLGSIGYALGTLAGARLFDQVRHGFALIGAAELISAGCLALVPLAPWLWMLLALVFCRGAMEGVVGTGANTLLLWTHKERASPVINGLHFCFGLGAFVAPLAVGRLKDSGLPYGIACWAVAGFAALAGLWMLTVRESPDPREHTRKATEDHARAGGLAYAPIALAAVFLFAYVSGEISFGSWICTFAVKLGVTGEAGAAYLNSAFWGSFTLGRLLSVAIALRFQPRQVIPAALLSCIALSLLLMVLPPSQELLWTVAIGLGFFMAPLWPSGYTLAGQVITMTAFTSGLVLLGDSLGGMVLPSLTGHVMELAGAERMSLSLPLLVLGSLIVCALAYVALLWVAVRRRVAAATKRALGGSSPPDDGLDRS